MVRDVDTFNWCVDERMRGRPSGKENSKGTIFANLLQEHNTNPFRGSSPVFGLAYFYKRLTEKKVLFSL